MGFWPFGGGKRQRVVETEEHGNESLLKRAPSGRGIIQQEKTGGEMQRSDDAERKMKPEELKTRRLTKTRSFGQQPASYASPLRSKNTPVQSVEDNRRASRTNSQYDGKALYQQTLLSQASLGPENFTVVRGPPTLHAKRSEADTSILRRKSSKRKAEDSAREREIRAMSSSPIPIPKRPATLYGSGPLQRDSRQIPGPLNRRLERPTSEISLPLPGSLPEFVDFPNQNSFKVGMLAALSPRPTVRYDANSRRASGKQPARPNMAFRQAIEEEDVSDKKRIDELADDLDAGGLRELMERDRRRRERKKDSDKAKLQRRLQRRAERQREEEARRARTEAFVQAAPPEAPRHHGVGINQQTQREGPSAARELFAREANDPFRDPEPLQPTTRDSIRNPFEDEKDMDIMEDAQDSDYEGEVAEGMPVPVRSPLRHAQVEEGRPRQKPSQSTLSPPVSPINRAADRSSLSQASFMHRETTLDAPESYSIERRTSDQSSVRLSSWTSFFRRGTRRKFTGPSGGRTTPSEFSNTSRESFSRKQLPVVAPRTFRRSDSATPQRTLSRFREDLPELPISPPDSRMQSPEISTTPSGNTLNMVISIDRTPSSRNSTGAAVGDVIDQTPQQRGGEPEIAIAPPVAMILSQSLASVDSEGSWLSGKPSKRQSGQLSHSIKPSQASTLRYVPGAFNEDDLGKVMDDKDDAVMPQPGAQELTRNTIGLSEPRDSQAPSEEEWHQGVEKHPTFVRQLGRAKSKEDLLNESPAADNIVSSSEEDEDDDDGLDPDSSSNDAETEAKGTSLLRARSVEYKGHIRHVSAGSAKLLDVKRSSVQSELNRVATAAPKSDAVPSTEATISKSRS